MTILPGKATMYRSFTADAILTDSQRRSTSDVDTRSDRRSDRQTDRQSCTSGTSTRASSGSSRGTGLRLILSPPKRDKPFGFRAKIAYDATENLLRSRSEAFIAKPPPKDWDIWKRPPPNFTPQNFINKPPKRNSKEAVQPWKYQESGRLYIITRDEPPEDDGAHLPSLLRPKRQVTPPLQTRFHIVDPDEARQVFVREGQNDAGPFADPTPHDFRAYPPLKLLGLPEFESKYEKDPFDINFKSSRLNIHTGSIHLGSTRDVPGVQMGDHAMRQPSKWEQVGHLPNLPFPNREHRYTRYRPIGRTPHSAMMDRAETVLTAKWAKEQLEKALMEQEIKASVAVS